MFTFHRTESHSAEVWLIAAAEETLPGAEARFGAARRHNLRDDSGGEGPARFHEVGVVFAFEATAGETEFLLACRDGLTPKEKHTLLVELEMLLGREVYGGGGEETAGWFLHDTLTAAGV